MAGSAVLNWPELAVGLAALLLVANAARRGFLREGSLLFGLCLALWLAGRLYRPVGAILAHNGTADGPPVALYAGLALVLLLLTLALSALVAPLVRRGPFRLLDRLGGLAVGLVEASLLVGAVALVGQRLGVFQPPPTGLLGRALDLASAGSLWLSAAIPAEILASGPH